MRTGPRALAIVAVLTIWVIPVAATGHGETRDTRLPPVGAPVKLLMVGGGLPGSVWGPIRAGAFAAARDLLIDLEIPSIAEAPLPVARDAQILLVESAATAGFEAVLIAPVDVTALVPYAADAVDADLPVVTILRPLDPAIPHVANDRAATGTLLAEQIAPRLPDRPLIATITDRAEDAADLALRAEIAERVPDVRALPAFVVHSPDDATSAVENLFFDNPDVSLIFVTDDHVLSAVVEAMRFESRPLVVAMGNLRSSLDSWENGELDLLAIPDLWEIGYRGIETTEQRRRGDRNVDDTPVSPVVLNAPPIPPGLVDVVERNVR